MVSTDPFMDSLHDIVYLFGDEAPQVRLWEAPFVQNFFN